MRIIYARSNYLPKCRIEGLRRYAFIGDSMVYGHGVTPDQTLPAAAERQMNACSAYPIEAVNLGISGNNLWNSWLDFKGVPQVYDGLVITLCSNDMELFGRTYKVQYQVPRSPAWEKTHPCGEAVASCFAEIAAFSKELSLPIAVCYYDTSQGPSQERIAEIIRDLCAVYGFVFIDSLVRIRELNLSRDDLRVSESDEHPSVRVHEAVGRYLVQILQRQKWFSTPTGASMSETADSIASSARAMVEIDHYPPETAQHWALRTLELKLHRARRLEASGADERLAAIAPSVATELAEANRYWHISQRLRTFLCRLSTLEQGRCWAWNVCDAEEEKLRLEELSFALGTGNWRRLAGVLRAADLAPNATNDALNQHWPLEASEFFEQCITGLQRSREALVTMSTLPAKIGYSAETATLLADQETLSRLTDRVIGECYRLKAAFARIDLLITGLRPDKSTPDDEIEYVSRLVSSALRRTKQCLGFVHRWPKKIEHACDFRYATFTTVDVTIQGKAPEGKPVYLITAQAEYFVPNRLPVRDTGNFFADGSCKVITLCVPLFYSGRLFLVVQPLLASYQPLEVGLVKVEVYNLPGQRQILPPQHFYRDEYNRYVSTMIYLT
jgi:hypothetical protein